MQDAYSDCVIGHFSTSPIRRPYSTGGKAQSTPFGTALGEGAWQKEFSKSLMFDSGGASE
jgi:hypothetical protein